MKGIGLQILLFVGLCAHYVAAALSSHEVNELVKNSGRSKTLKLSNDNFLDLLGGKRDYHLVLMLSSSSTQFNCPLCNEVRPEYEILANSWFREHANGKVSSNANENEEEDVGEEKNLYFAYAEFIGAENVFKEFGLKSIPKITYLPPTTSPKTQNYLENLQEYQFYAGDHKQLLADWIREITGYKINIYIPPNYSRIATFAVFTFIVASLSKRYSSYIFKLATSTILWAAISLVLVLLLTSGYMFNQIRGTPYLREYPDGRVEYFVPGQQNQYGIETQVVSFIYGMLSVLFIVLVKSVPTIKNAQVNLIAVCTVSILILCFYSILLNVFGLKGMGYPFRLLKFGLYF